eukprot:scaffold125830_cov13-Tisochrysis_lutea.AAC.1
MTDKPGRGARLPSRASTGGAPLPPKALAGVGAAGPAGLGVGISGVRRRLVGRLWAPRGGTSKFELLRGAAKGPAAAVLGLRVWAPKSA